MEFSFWNNFDDSKSFESILMDNKSFEASNAVFQTEACVGVLAKRRMPGRGDAVSS